MEVAGPVFAEAGPASFQLATAYCVECPLPDCGKASDSSALYVWATAPTASIDPYARYLGDHPWDGGLIFGIVFTGIGTIIVLAVRAIGWMFSGFVE
jgi:hypothetical protein